MPENPYKPIPAELLDVIEESGTIKTFVLRPEKPIPFEAGQFIEMEVPGVGEAPFTPSSSPAVSEQMDVTVMRVGKVTETLHDLSPGATLGLRGPLGKPYPVDTEFRDKELVVIGGGVGLAPLRSLLFALLDRIDTYKKVVVRFGARSPGDIIYKELMRKWMTDSPLEMVISVDADDTGEWKGPVGVVTTILDDLPVDVSNALAIVCGPPIMMKFATFKLVELGFADSRIYLSMEKNMSCGIGKCGHCRLGPHFVCEEGPVMKYSEIKNYEGVWD